MRRVSFLVFLVCALSVPAAAQQQFVVDYRGGPGVTHTELQPAIDAARPGDRIRIQQGLNWNYGPFVIDKGIVLEGTETPFGTIVLESRVSQGVIRDVPAGQTVRLERVVFTPTVPLPTGLVPTLQILNCRGAVSLVDCALRPGSGAVNRAHPPLRIRFSTAVALERLSYSAPGGVRLGSIEGSSVSFRSCRLINPLTARWGDGDMVLTINGSSVVFDDCVVKGHDGGDAGVLINCIPGGDGGAALVTSFSRVVLLGRSLLLAGFGGLPFGSCRGGAPGVALIAALGSDVAVDPSVVVQGVSSGSTRPVPLQPWLSTLPRALPLGGSAPLELRTMSPGSYVLFLEVAPGFTWLPGIELPVQLASASFPWQTGSVPALGLVRTSFLVPNLPDLIGERFWCQAAFLDPAGALRLSGAVSTAVE